MAKTVYIYSEKEGRVININDLPQEERKEKHFRTSIARDNGLRFGGPQKPQTRIVRDSKGDLKWIKK